MEKKEYKDRKLGCLDCGAEFAFSAGEQFFYWSKGLSEPKRCPACRRRRKITIMPSREGGVL